MIDSNRLLAEVLGGFERLSQTEKKQLLEKYGFVLEDNNSRTTSGAKAVHRKKQTISLGVVRGMNSKGVNGANVRFCVKKGGKAFPAKERIPVVAQIKKMENKD